MQKYMSKDQFKDFKQKQWITIFLLAVILIPFISLQLAIASGLIGGFCLLRCSQWGLFD